MAVYSDTSALAKLVLQEAETAALLAYFETRQDTIIAGAIAFTELIRAVRRGDPAAEPRAHAFLESVHLIETTSDILQVAATLDPPTVRTLDAIHLASALTLGDELEAIVTYDQRMADAARQFGMHVVAPQ